MRLQALLLAIRKREVEAELLLKQIRKAVGKKVKLGPYMPL
jgi:hypothetical protein